MPAGTAAPAPPAAARRVWWSDAGVLAAVAIALRIPAFFASRHLTFDDGQYGTVVLGLRDGDAPFRDLFSSQGPLYYPLLYVADLVGFRTLDGPRILTVAAGVVAAIVTYSIARRITSRGGALLAGVLVASSGSVLFVTAGLSGDGPALALALTAVALALAYESDPGGGRAVLVGLAMGASLCVKLIVLPAAVPVGLALMTRRRWSHLGMAIGAAVGVFLATALPWGIERVWDQSIAYHQESERLRSYAGNAWVLLRTVAERDPFVLAAAVLSVVALVWASRRGSASSSIRSTTDAPPAIAARTVTLVVVAWLLAQVAFLVAEPAMWRPHVSQVIAPLALLAALHPAPLRVLVAVFVVLAPWWVLNTDDILLPGSYDRDEQAVVDRLRELPAGAWVISDDPGLVWRAERRVPGNFVDVSKKRIQQRQLTAGVVARAADATQVCSVVVWSPARFGSLRSLSRRLTAAGYEVAARYGGPRVLYERSDCDP